MRKLGSTDLKRLHRQWRRKTDRRVDVLIENVQGPFNVGAILRTAAAYRVEHVWVVGQAARPDNAKVGKTALGSDRFVTWSEHADVSTAAAGVRKAGLSLVSVELTDEAKPIHESDLSGNVCIAVGNEDFGCSAALLDASDQVVFLPQLGRIGSLNVGTAANIALYETRRQHLTS